MSDMSDISQDFVLHKAVQDATKILLGKYSIPAPSTAEHRLVDHDVRIDQVNDVQSFITRMAIIAWNFLNVSDLFQSNRNVDAERTRYKK